jgi:putative ABC transport system permease protein
LGTWKHVVRSLLRSPMFTVVTLLTIGLGVGANTAIFSVINGILLKALPYPDPQALVSVRQASPGLNIPNLELSPSDYFTFKSENRAFQEFGIWGGNSVSVTGLEAPEQVRALNVTEGTLNALGVQPTRGRWFSAQDCAPGAPKTVLVTYGYWQRKFGGDPAAVGRRIVADGEANEIIGVLPQSFRFLDEKADLIFPFRFDPAKTMLGNFSYSGIARLKPGVSMAQANSDVARMIPIVNTKFPAPPGFSVKLFEQAHILPNVKPLKEEVVGSLGTVLWVLMGSIGVVLLIACANVANLLLVRAEARQQELAIRAALGAGSRRIAAELLSESVLLGLLGGAAGLGLASGHLPRLENISIDPAALAFTFAISLAAGLLFGVIPVWKYAGPNIVTAIRAGGRSLSQNRQTRRTRNTLVVLQMALAAVLLIGSGLMIRTFQAMRQVDPGFRNPAELQTLGVFIPEAQVKDPVRALRMQQAILDKLAAIPGVTSAAFANSVPTDGNNSTDLLYAEDRTYREGQLPPLRRFKFVAPGFFQTMGTPLVAGRDITWTDIYDKRPVTMISENMAREMWQSPQAALGKRIREGMKDEWREVVGVVANVRLDGADQKAPSVVYWPVLMTQFWGSDPFLFRSVVYTVRTSRAGSESFLQQVRQAVWSINPDLPLARVRTMEMVYSASMARSSFTLVMLGIAGGMALLLGIVGIYGVISYSVSQRRRELGIRIALGAPQNSLKGMVVRNGLLLAAIGVGIGLGVAAALTRLMSSLLFEVSALDPITYVAVAVGLLAAAAFASYVPAHRAAGVSPVEALQSE